MGNELTSATLRRLTAERGVAGRERRRARRALHRMLNEDDRAPDEAAGRERAWHRSGAQMRMARAHREVLASTTALREWAAQADRARLATLRAALVRPSREDPRPPLARFAEHLETLPRMSPGARRSRHGGRIALAWISMVLISAGFIVFTAGLILVLSGAADAAPVVFSGGFLALLIGFLLWILVLRADGFQKFWRGVRRAETVMFAVCAVVLMLTCALLVSAGLFLPQVGGAPTAHGPGPPLSPSETSPALAPLLPSAEESSALSMSTILGALAMLTAVGIEFTILTSSLASPLVSSRRGNRITHAGWATAGTTFLGLALVLALGLVAYAAAPTQLVAITAAALAAAALLLGWHARRISALERRREKTLERIANAEAAVADAFRNRRARVGGETAIRAAEAIDRLLDEIAPDPYAEVSPLPMPPRSEQGVRDVLTQAMHTLAPARYPALIDRVFHPVTACALDDLGLRGSPRADGDVARAAGAVLELLTWLRGRVRYPRTPLTVRDVGASAR